MIQSEVSNLIKQSPTKRVEYKVPKISGTMGLSQPIKIPPHKFGVSLYFGGQVVQPITDFDFLINMGKIYPSGAISQWAAYTTQVLAEAAKGQLYVDVSGAPALPTTLPFYAIVYSHKTLSGLYVRQELVKVVAYNTTTGRAYLAEPLCDDYITEGGQLPRLVLCDADVTVSPYVEGLTLNMAPQSNEAAKVQQGLWFGLAQNPAASNITAKNFETDALRLDFGRGYSFQTITTYDSETAGAGLGRCVAINNSHHGVVRRGSYKTARHGVMFSVGSTNGSMVQQTASDMGDAAWDFGHGLGCRDLSGSNLQGSDIQLGNGTYVDGVNTVTLDNCVVDYLRLVGSVTGMVASRIQAKALNLQGTDDGGVAKYPTNYLITSSAFHQKDPVASLDPFSITGFGATTRSATTGGEFRDVQFTQANNAGGRRCLLCDDAKTAIGLRFIRCDFQNLGTGVPIRIMTTVAPYPVLDFFFTRCSVRSGAQYAIQFGANTSGTHNINNNQLFDLAAGGGILTNGGLATGPAPS